MIPQETINRKDELLQYGKSLWIDVDKISDVNLFLQAFVHKSFAADFKEIWDHNERLEFLWDWALEAVICKLLFKDHPEMDESAMTLYKIALVREENLAAVARNIGLDEKIMISKWEEKMHWRRKDAIISDALESLIWFIFFDLWYEETEKFVSKYVYTMYDKIDKNPVKSYKTMAQEKIQHDTKETPTYIDFDEEVDKKWNVIKYKSQLTVNWQILSEWFGTNKKKAQEDAAKIYYESVLSRKIWNQKK